MRIVGGAWRSRKVSFAPVEGLRPTPDRVRETLFNWLQFDLGGARCLDVFAGSGILGLEAASRGAASVLLIEQDREACAAIAESIKFLRADNVELRQGDAIGILDRAPNEAYDIVFLDPPFRKGLVSAAAERLEACGWLAPGSRIYLEQEAELQESKLPANWRKLKSGSAGDVAFYLYERQ